MIDRPAPPVRSAWPCTLATLLIASTAIAGGEEVAQPARSRARSVEAARIALVGDWTELARLDLDTLDPATAELAIHRGVEPGHGSGDAATHYFRMLLMLPEEEDHEAFAALNESPFAERIDRLRAGAFAEELENRSSMVTPLRAAVRSASCDWSVTLESGIYGLRTELGSMQPALRRHLLGADAEIAADRPWEARRRYREALAWSRDVAADAVLVGTATGMAMETATLERIIEATPSLVGQGIPADRLARIVRRRYRNSPDLEAVLFTEGRLVRETMRIQSPLDEPDAEAMWSALAEFLEATSMSIHPVAFRYEPERPGWLRRAAVGSGRIDERDASDPAAVARWLVESVNHLEGHLDETLLASRLPRRARLDALERIGDMRVEERTAYPLTYLFASGAEIVVSRAHEAETRRRAVDLLLAAALIRDAEGAWPEGIADLRDGAPWLPTSVSGGGASIRLFSDVEADTCRVVWTDEDEDEQSLSIAWPDD